MLDFIVMQMTKANREKGYSPIIVTQFDSEGSCNEFVPISDLQKTRKSPLHDPVTWCGINYAGTQVTQWDFQTKKLLPGQPDFCLFWKSHCVMCVPANIIYSLPCDLIVERAYYAQSFTHERSEDLQSYNLKKITPKVFKFRVCTASIINNLF